MKNKNYSIEGLRGVIVLMIVFFHLIWRFTQLYTNTIVPNFLGISKWGEIGRSIFLVLSIYFLYISREYEIFSFCSYIWKKILRIWPMYFISITLTYIITNLVHLSGRTYGFGVYLANTIFINGFVGIEYIDGAHWYLTTLLSIYIIYGVLLKLKLQKKTIGLYVWLLVGVLFKALAILLNAEWISLVYKAIGGEYIGFVCIGISLRIWIMSNKNRNIPLDRWIIFFVAIIYSLVFAKLWQTFGLLLGCCLIIYCETERCFFDKKILIQLGTISYPLYLCHQNISYCIEYLLLKWSGRWNVLYAIIATIVCIILSLMIIKIDNFFKVGVRKKMRKN